MPSLPWRVQQALLRQGHWKPLLLEALGRDRLERLGERRIPPVPPRAAGEPAAMLFCCGLGDLLYGLDAIGHWVDAARAEGRRCIAAVFQAPTRASNPAVASLIAELGWFDAQVILPGEPGPDWRAPAAPAVLERHGLPASTVTFRYRVHAAGPRPAEVARSLGLGAAPSPRRIAMLAAQPSPAAAALLAGAGAVGPSVLLHARSRSIGYSASFAAALARRLLDAGFRVLALDPDDGMPAETVPIPVGSVGLLDLVRVLSQRRIAVVSVQSVSWPAAWLADVPLLGFHTTLLSDVGSFMRDRMTMVSPMDLRGIACGVLRPARLGRDYDLDPDSAVRIIYREAFALAELDRWLAAGSASTGTGRPDQA